jgi:hypothetical protein
MKTRLLLVAMSLTATAAAQTPPPVVSVREAGSAYIVEARFDVAASTAVVREVLTDYDGIPRFMPDIRTSIVRSREGSAVTVEQEAQSRFLMFSKTIHLLLQVQEGAHVLSFQDLCGASFTRYEGSWTLAAAGNGTTVVYKLTADPSFKVPASVIRRLLERNARQTIEHLRAEAGLRGAAALRAAR